MSKKHYVRAAAIIAGNYACCVTAGEEIAVMRIALSLADMFAQDNPRFDRQRFYTACRIDRHPFNGS